MQSKWNKVAFLQVLSPWLSAAMRAAAVVLGMVLVAGMLRRLAGGYDLSIWVVDLRKLPEVAGGAIKLLGGLGLLGWGIRPKVFVGKMRWVMLLPAGVLLAAVLWNVISFYRLLADGAIAAGIWVPVSAGVGAVVAGVMYCVIQQKQSIAGPWRIGMVGMILAGLLPLVQVFAFGKTDYRRPADVIVVPGARVYRDGRISDALRDRMDEAVRLYDQGLAPVMIVSGGPGDGSTSEPVAMRQYAIDHGVPAGAIWIDEQGLNTAATARNTKQMMQSHGMSHALVVSHFFHLPRLKMAFGQQRVEVWTVPAQESYVLMQLPWLVVRESPALWAYAMGMAPEK